METQLECGLFVDKECSICLREFPDDDERFRIEHVAKHLKKIAMLALPRTLR